MMKVCTVAREMIPTTRFAPFQGVYILLNNQEAVYVGRSDSIHLRIKQHFCSNDISFTQAVLIQCGHNRMLENALIWALKPSENRKSMPIKGYITETELSRRAQAVGYSAEEVKPRMHAENVCGTIYYHDGDMA